MFFLQSSLTVYILPSCLLAGSRQTDGKNLVWFGKIERKLAKLSKTIFAYRSSS
jgi:hypothetical protein